MSLTLRPKVEGNASEAPDSVGMYGTRQVMHHGLGAARDSSLLPANHPLEQSEALWQDNKDKLNMVTTRNMFGLHMPLKLNMERHAAQQVGRLPCMSSRVHNLMYETLTGQDELLDPADIFNNPSEFSEKMGNPHAVMEKKLNIL